MGFLTEKAAANWERVASEQARVMEIWLDRPAQEFSEWFWRPLEDVSAHYVHALNSLEDVLNQSGQVAARR